MATPFSGLNKYKREKEKQKNQTNEERVMRGNVPFLCLSRRSRGDRSA